MTNPAPKIPPHIPAKVTLAQDAYLNIRADIISGTLEPNQPLRLEALRERYGISFSPIREALQRLESERLVDLTALRGFRVASISLDKMWDSIRTRILIENEGIRLSVAHGKQDWELRVLSSFQDFTANAAALAAATSDPRPLQDALERSHWQFHSALFSASGSEWIATIAEQLYAQTERYRRPMLLTAARNPAGRDIVAEHRDLMASVLKRDADQSRHLLTQHYTRTGQVIETWLAAKSA